MSARPRILFFGPGHSPIVRGRIAPFLDEFQAAWITTTEVPASFRRAHPGLALHVLPRALLRRLPRQFFVHTADYIAELWARVLRFRPDVIHLHYVSPLDALALAPVRRTPIVLSVMGGDVLEDQVPRGPVLDRALRALMQRAAAVTAKSEFLAEQCRQLGTPRERLEVVRWGIDTKRFAPQERRQARRALGLPEEGRVLLSSRALQPLYNHAPVVEATAALGSAAPTLVFTRHAAEPAYAAEIEARAEALGLSTRFLESQSPAQMPSLYAAADACVSIPASDGLPQTLLEALACERPSLGLDLDAYRELPFPSDALIRVPHTKGVPDQRALEAGLSELMREGARPGLASSREWIADHAELNESVARIKRLYRELSRRQ